MNEIYQYLKDLFKKNKNYISEEGELLIFFLKKIFIN